MSASLPQGFPQPTDTNVIEVKEYRQSEFISNPVASVSLMDNG
ncbi:hypothetical protein [Okeania sp. SIO2C2]|nr:hypothetical protein [Okeania sp. SIO2C2]